MVSYEEIDQSPILSEKKKDELRSLAREIKKQKEVNIEDQIRRDQKHREFINICIHPFQVGSEIYDKTGYVFVCVDPLYGVGKGFDVLVYSAKSRSAILIECKSIISNPDDVLKDVNEKIRDTKNNIGCLEDLVGGKIEHNEFVLCTPAIEVTRLLPAFEKIPDKPNTIVWLVDLTEEVIRLHPEFERHGNGFLSQKFSGSGLSCLEANRIVNFLPSSHMGTILQGVVGILDIELSKTEEVEFGFPFLCEIVKRELRNCPDKRIGELSQKILDSGLNAEIFSPVREGRTYVLDVRRRNVAESAKEKYIRYKARLAAEKDAAEKIAEKYKFEAQKTITNFESKNT